MFNGNGALRPLALVIGFGWTLACSNGGNGDDLGSSESESSATSGVGTESGGADSGDLDTGTETGTQTTDESETGTQSDSDTETGTEDGSETDTETGIEQVCGNGVLEIGEACDGEQLDGQTCITFGHLGGELICGSDCALDESACVDQLCDCDLAPFGVDHHCHFGNVCIPA